MQWFAFDSHKHDTWALAQSETGKHSSLFPPPYHLRPTHPCLLLLDRQRASRDVARTAGLPGGDRPQSHGRLQPGRVNAKEGLTIPPV